VRACFVGDSFVNGTGDDACLGWVGRVCAAMRARGSDITVYNLGIRRDTSADIAARWRDETSRRLPDGVDGLLVFSFGVNDTTVENGAPRIRPQESIANARAILGTARGRWPTLMVGPPPIDDAAQNERTEALSKAFAGVCHELEVAYLETYRPLLQVEAWLSEARAGDGAHPNAGGYAALASLVAAWPAWQAKF
jgi:lysophospholipase L1-like esterase